MRTTRRLRAASAALMLPLLLTATSAHAEGRTTIGGDRLASPGFITPIGAPKLPPTVAAAFVVADLDTGAILAAKDPHGEFLPASVLKTLTALTLIPRLNPKQLVKPTFDDVNVDGTRVGLVDTQTYPVDELFRSMLIVSGNDSALTLATANGGLAKTVAEMNAEAANLQADDTHAVNDNGLDAPTQHTSAYDMALIARAAMQIPQFRAYVGTKHSYIRGSKPHSRIDISTHDKLLYNYPGAIGIKNGFTVAARATFVGAATRGGHTLVVTLMKTAPRYWPEAASLLDWGFAATAAGVQPVGQLVNPLVDPTAVGTPQPKTGGQSVPIRNAAVAKPSNGDGGLPVLPIGIVGAGIVVIAWGFSRRGRRDRGKLTLPKI